MTFKVPKKIEHVIVVIYSEDVELFLIQLRSLDLFLEKCNLHVIINETNTRPVYKKIAEKISTSKHNVHVWTREQILGYHPNVSGWSSQQLLKLLIPLKCDYIVLDSKDIFIRPVSLLELDRKQSKDYEDLSMKDPQGPFWQGLLDLGKNQGYPLIDPKLINQNQTPRVIDKRVIDRIIGIFGTKKNFIDWFCTFKVQGEFILHDYLYEVLELPPKQKFPQGFSHAVWTQEIFNKWPFESLPDTVHLYKCHRRVYNIKENKEKFDLWIQRVFKTYEEYYKALKNG